MIYLSVAIVPKSRFVQETVGNIDGSKTPVFGPDGKPAGNWMRISRPVLLHRHSGWGIADPAVKGGHLIALAQAMLPRNKSGKRTYAGKWVRTYAENTTYARAGVQVFGELWTEIPDDLDATKTAPKGVRTCGWGWE